MPASLETVAAAVVETCTNYPAALSWKAHAQLGQQVLDAAGAVPWPTIVTGPKAAHLWALDLALPVVKTNADAESVTVARAVIDRVVNELAAVPQPDAAGLATTTHEKLLLLLPQQHDLWAVVALRHVDLLTADAAATFDANVRSGESEKNTDQTDAQQKILTLLSDVVKQQPALAPTGLQKLNVHLQKWSAARHDTVVEAAYQAFAVDLPPVTQRRTQLALAAMWFNQVLREHAHVMSNGFQVPRALDERIQATLKQCYQLAADVGVDDPLQASAALLRKRVVDHFLALEYEDVAEAAIKVRADVASTDLDEAAELELAALKRRVAERQLAKRSKQHNGRKQIVLTPAYNESIAALKQFITDHPTSERVPVAANEVLSIGLRFEQYEAWTIAADIYEDFEVFAANIDSLKQARPKEPTYPEKAAMARAAAMHMRASHALARWKSENSDDAPPPDQLSDEFQTAQAAWHKVIGDYQQRPVVQTAIARSMSIATEYAAADAWDVADSIYGTLLGLQLPLQAPERLEFGRAICQLGKVLPDHARTVLAALDVINAGRDDDKNSDGDQLMAMGAFEIVSRLGQLESPGSMLAGRDLLGSVARASSGRKPESGLAAAEDAAAEVADESGVAPTAPPVIADLSVDVAEQDGFGIGGGGYSYQRRFKQKADAQLIAAVRTQLDRQASQVAMLRDKAIQFRETAGRSGGQQAQKKVPVPAQQQATFAPVLSEAELLRQQQVPQGACRLRLRP
jgi:hypothetical protein